ncbi:MAG: quinolinate synthase NadA [Elusimicrobiota bacterium]
MKDAEMPEKIAELKKQRKAVILAHNYQLPEIQDIADYLGDSLELSRMAAKTDAEVVVFCGVHFMAETASIICPDKKVLLPDINAGCPLANMITPSDVRKLKEKYPGRPVVSYVNTSAEVKAETDVACTSANAIKVINSIKDDEIIFVPDKYLADYVRKQTGKRIIHWEGYCPTHVKILPEDVSAAKKAHPGARVMVHPECRSDVIDMADAVISTSGMVRYVKEADGREFIIGTETGLIHRLKKENPGKEFFPASPHAVCPNMKSITLEKVLWSLEDMKPEVSVPENIRKAALRSVNRMLELA